jgi:tight adherence protein C
MSLAAVLGILAGVGCLGMIRSLNPTPPTLEAIAAALDRRTESEALELGRPGSIRSGARSVVRVLDGSSFARRRWRSLAPDLAITGDTPEEVASRMLVLGGAGILAPPLLWLLGAVTGITALPFGIAMALAIVGASAGASWPIIDLARRARTRRRHVRAVVGCFVDLVVLNLAGGMGVESALFTAAQVSSDWAAQLIGRSLTKVRESGQPSWLALSRLGEEIGVPELVEVSATLELAGTEGSRIRQSLTARAAALRRHEQADAETAANTMTERLFLPGALLLVGFVLFVGYPAFSRILGGF